LAIGGVGGMAAVRIGIPLPWMLGPMILVTLSAMASPPIEAPIGLRRIMLPVLGVMLGSGFHPGVLGSLADWAVTIALLPIYVLAAFSGAYLIYRKIGRYDPVTAYFSSAPGGLNDMMIFGAEAGGIERNIALAHASRILIVVSFVSLTYGFFLGISTAGARQTYVSFASVPVRELALLGLCAVAGAFLAPRVGLPAPQILGPMILSAIVHLVGLTDSSPPTLLVNMTQVVLGTVIGCRFLGVPAPDILRNIALAAVASTAMLVVTLAAAFLVTEMTDAPLRETFLIFSPGGLPEMSLLALSLDADVAYVATIHLLRITLVIAAAPVFFRLLRGRIG
jgi:membrane AbrB-like protein